MLPLPCVFKAVPGHAVTISSDFIWVVLGKQRCNFPPSKSRRDGGTLPTPTDGVPQPGPRAGAQPHPGLRGEAAEIFGFYQLKTN